MTMDLGALSLIAAGFEVYRDPVVAWEILLETCP